MDFKSLISGIFIFIFGILVCIGAYNLGLGNLHKPGTGLIVFLAGSVMALLSVVDIIKGLTSKGLGIKVLLSLWEGTYWKKGILILIGTTIYTLILNSVGFLILTPFYTAFCIRLFRSQTWLRTIMTSIFSTLIFYLLTFFFKLPISPLPEFLNFYR